MGRNNPLAALLAGMADESDEPNEDGSERMPEANAAGRAADLAERFARYQHKNDFKPGDLVVWKAGMKNRRFPLYGEPVIVFEVFDSPLRVAVDDQHGSQAYYELYHGRLCHIDPDGDMSPYTHDFNRFEPYNPA